MRDEDEGVRCMIEYGMKKRNFNRVLQFILSDIPRVKRCRRCKKETMKPVSCAALV